MAAVSNMYERIGNASGHLGGNKRKPTSFAALVLPPAAVLRRVGLGDGAGQSGLNRGHLFAKWETHPFKKGATVEAALAVVESFNLSSKRCVKIRINFSDGTSIVMARTTPSDPETLKATGTYDPQEVFAAKTRGKAGQERAVAQSNMAFIVDERGHLKARSAASGSTFAPERQFADCPVSEPKQTGFAFTPVGYNSYMNRPNYHIPGCRPGVGDFNDNAINVRPRGFNTDTFYNDDEVGNRNEVSRERLSRAGQHVYTGAFLRASSGKGASLAPTNVRNTAAARLSQSIYGGRRAQSAGPLMQGNSTSQTNNGNNNITGDGNDNAVPRPPDSPYRRMMAPRSSKLSSHKVGTNGGAVLAPGGRVRPARDNTGADNVYNYANDANNNIDSRYYSEGTQTPARNDNNNNINNDADHGDVAAAAGDD